MSSHKDAARRIAIVVGAVVGSMAGSVGASTYQFQTVYHGDSAMTGSPAGVLTDVEQVVLSDDGKVATIARFGGTTAVTLNAAGDANLTTLAESTQTIYGGGGSFGAFYNLSASTSRVTFVCEANGASGSFGLYRYEASEGMPQTRIFVEGDSIGGRAASLNTGSTPTYGINAAGDVVFNAKTIVSSDQVLARWNTGSSAPAVLLDQTSPQSEFNNPVYPPTRVMTASGAAVFAAEEGGSRRIYGMDSSSPLAQQRVGGTLSIGSFDYQPYQVAGATGDASSGATLFRAIKDPSGSPQFALAMRQSSGATIEIGSFDGAAMGSLQLVAEMSENGNVAAYIPTSSGGKIVYATDDGSSSPTTIISVGDAIGGGFTIAQISAIGSSPMVNDNGLVVFDAQIEDGSGNTHAALLTWREGTGSPTIILKSGDDVEINGQSFNVAPFSMLANPFLANVPTPGMFDESSTLKDGLNDSDQLAFSLKYLAGSELRTAVLVTQIPEPTSVSVLVLSLAVLSQRCRRTQRC